MLSLGIDASLALAMASARRGLPSGSPPPSLAATVIARASFVKSLPRRASTIAFLCLIPAHFECPAMTVNVRPRRPAAASGREALRVRPVPLERRRQAVAERHARRPAGEPAQLAGVH